MIPRRALLSAARVVGMEAPARAVGRMLASSEVRRNHRDGRRLAALLRHELSADANCVDVGAHVGSFTALIISIAPEGRHYAFEPLPGLAQSLEARFPSVTVVAAALGDHNGEAPFHRSHGTGSRSGFQPWDAKLAYEEMRVRVHRLDDFLPDDYRPAFVKVDVEGAELAVFRGAEDTLRRHRPIVAFEHGGAARSGFGVPATAVFDFLSSVGLRMFDMDGRLLSRELFGREGWNFVARR